jgi:CheY-like chemotaxis protein
MTNPRPRGIVSFLREARRRKVYVSVVAYVGVAVVLIELTGPVAEALLLPDWTSRLVTFLLLLGFPVVVVLSWTFDITGKGVVRTSEEGQTLPNPDASGPTVAPAGGALPSRDSGFSSAGAQTKTKHRGTRLPMPSLRRRRRVPPVGATADGSEEGAEDGGGDRPPDPEQLRRATLAHLRHELRTPINGIIGYAEMLLEDVEEESFTGDLERILNGGRRLLGLIDETLGNGAAGAEARDLESYADQIRMDLRTPVTSVVGYAEMLLETAREEGREALVPDLERIHTAAHRLLELSGDLVGLATADGPTPSEAGSPASALTRAVLSKIQPTGGEGLGTGEGRLLVVDDNAMNRDLLSRQLARQGYIVLTASEGNEALELLRSQTVDLILLDVFMPGMDGVETLRKLKADEKLQEIPVLMLSSLDEVDGALRCIEMGAEDYLSKPVKPAILEVRIAANLELHRMRERERVYEERVVADEGFIEELLLSAFPEEVAERVRVGDSEVADVVPEATVLSCHIRGLSAPASSAALRQGLRALREVGVAVETLARGHGLETIIWRPDGFVAVSGAPSPVEDHTERAAALGRAFLAQLSTLSSPEGGPIRLGLGLHSGPVVAAALGGDRLRYEVWGEGVKTADSVARAAPDGALLVSPPVHARLRDSYSFEAKKVRDIAGVQMRTYVFRGDGGDREA